MFVINSKNIWQFIKKIKPRNIYTLINSIPLYIKTMEYISRGSVDVANKVSNRKILILMHFGLGDFFNMLPAIKYLAINNREVHVFVNRDNLAELNRFISQSNIYLKAIEDEAKLDDYYRINVARLRKKYFDYDLMAIGKFNKKFAFHYPISFYLELGIDPNIAFSEKFYLDESSIREKIRIFFETMPKPYVFTHLVASNSEKVWAGDVDHDTLILDPFVNRNSVSSKNFKVAQMYLELKPNLIEHLFFMINSSECFLIDSSFFNFIAHVDYKGKAHAYMRGQYFHKLDERLMKNFSL